MQGCFKTAGLAAAQVRLFLSNSFLGFVLCFVFVVVAPSLALAQKRVALVIGNANYAKVPLANPANDARLMSETLKRFDFDVIMRLDADKASMMKAFQEFGQALRGTNNVGLFYYAGHGVQISGQNFLIPVGNAIATNKDVLSAGVNFNELLKTMGRSKSRVNIAILDACRDNPFANASEDALRGLAPVDAPSGTLVAFATGPGQVAYDGQGEHSPYTAALARAIPTPGVVLEEVFRRTRREVLTTTKQRQLPREYSSLTGEFFFNPQFAVAEGHGRKEDLQNQVGTVAFAELKAWEKIKETNDPAKLKEHLARFPGGVFSELASVRLARLEKEAHGGWASVITGAVSNNKPSKSLEKAKTLYGKGVEAESRAKTRAEFSVAFNSYKRAARLGLPIAMYRLARSYDKGLGVKANIKKAAYWYRKAANDGHVKAMASLGTLYEFGEGVKKSVVSALVYYRLAAEHGNADAMTSLGYLYGEGKGVAKDERQARRWYGTAADLGQARAMFNLGLMLRQGRGGPADSEAAARWFQKAAEQGHTGAMRELAFLYDNGRGLPRNPVKAAINFIAAIEGGNNQALEDVKSRRRKWNFSTKRQMQRLLGARGLYNGYVHGFFDKRTRRALEQLAPQVKKS